MCTPHQNQISFLAIFGMDVGGTLTKIVYFEKNGMRPLLRGVSCPEPEASSASVAGTGLSSQPSEPSPMRRSKSLSQLDGEEHQEALRKLYEYMDSSNTYGKTGFVLFRFTPALYYS